jgi:hypothetical protein
VFLEVPENPTQYQVDHIDRNKENNSAENLQWLDRKAHAAKTSGKKVAQLDLLGRVVAIYPTGRDAAKAVKCSFNSMSETLRGLHKVCGGYRWEYATVEHINSKEEIKVEEHKIALLGKSNYQPVVQKSQDGKVIATYETVKEAAKAMGVTPSAIGLACRKPGRCKGFAWEYAERLVPRAKTRKLLIPQPIENPGLDEFLDSHAHSDEDFLPNSVDDKALDEFLDSHVFTDEGMPHPV